VPLLHVEIFIFEKYKNLDFWQNFKVSSLGRFWQIWAVLGSFEQFWADFAASTVVDSMPQLGLKS
jgi:hypothetical protein